MAICEYWVMTMLNRIKEFLDNRPDPISGASQTSPYRFWQDTGIGRDTAYRMYNDPTYIPTSGALNKICEAYRMQPGDFLCWVPDSASIPLDLDADLPEKSIHKDDPATMKGQTKKQRSSESSLTFSLKSA
jgi:Cro/C1-type HTH DNA-binding domain